MSLEQLEAELLAVEATTEPDRWAIAAYRVAVARSESAVGADAVNDAVDLLKRAGRILTATRAPVEHARILTATANCHRRLSEPGRAVALFAEAVNLLAGRGAPAEHAAALTNLGLAHIESGNPSAALDPLTATIAILGGAGATDEEVRRVRGAAFLNRAQAHQASADTADLRSAIVDYTAAASEFDHEAPQRGMAFHGLGATILELQTRGDAEDGVDLAIDAFHQSLRILTVDSFPFQHALAEHSLAIAYERRGESLDLERALDSAETSVSIFDPRLHQAQWVVAVATLQRIEASLDAEHSTTGRTGHVLRLIASTDDAERDTLMRTRLRRLSDLPRERTSRDLAALTYALVGLEPHDYARVMRSMIPVLMELPETVLDVACEELCAAHRTSRDQIAYDAALDEIVHDLLHGPQRVRVRDLLESHGWIRP